MSARQKRGSRRLFMGGSGHVKKSRPKPLHISGDGSDDEVRNIGLRGPSKFMPKGPNLPHHLGKSWWHLKRKLADGSTHCLNEEFADNEGLRLCIFGE